MKRTLPILAVVAAATLALAGCSASPASPSNTGITIVATTSVYGDIASTLVGDLGTVTSLIGDSAVDPHSFEASARDQLTIADADLVIANGGGYDLFIDALVEASGSKAVLLNAVDVSGLDGVGQPGFNEHVWYSMGAMTRVIQAIADELGTIDPANQPTFEANAATLVSKVKALETRESMLAPQFTGDGAAVTEAVPLYMIEALGLANLTPGDFTEAIEEGSDVPPLALQDTLDLFTSGSVRVLGYNEQTASPETERVRRAAEDAGIPVVSFTETLPQGADYVSWMGGNLDALAAAIQQ